MIATYRSGSLSASLLTSEPNAANTKSRNIPVNAR